MICQARGEEVPPISFSFDSSGFRRNLEETVNAGMQNLARQFQQRVDRVQGLRWGPTCGVLRIASPPVLPLVFKTTWASRMPNFAAQ